MTAQYTNGSRKLQRLNEATGKWEDVSPLSEPESQLNLEGPIEGKAYSKDQIEYFEQCGLWPGGTKSESRLTPDQLPSKEAFAKVRAMELTTVVLSGPDMFYVLGNLQLALRHPENVGHSARIARELATEIEKRITDEVPELKELCAMGWKT